MSLLEYWFKCIFCIPKQIINNINIFFKTPLYTLLLLFIIHRREIYTKAKGKKVFFQQCTTYRITKIVNWWKHFSKEDLKSIEFKFKLRQSKFIIVIIIFIENKWNEWINRLMINNNEKTTFCKNVCVSVFKPMIFFYWMLMCIFESRAHILTLHGIDNKSKKQMRGIRKKKNKQ